MAWMELMDKWTDVWVGNSARPNNGEQPSFSLGLHPSCLNLDRLLPFSGSNFPFLSGTRRVFISESLISSSE